MKRRLALAALLAGLALVPGAAASPQNTIVGDITVTPTYDPSTKKLTVSWSTTGNATRLKASAVWLGASLDGNGVVQQTEQVYGGSGNTRSGTVSFTRDFYVQVVFQCFPEFTDGRRCGDFGYDATETYFSKAVKVAVKAAPSGPSATLVLKKGTATITRADGTKGPLKPGSVLGPGDQIKTAANSVAELAFSDGSKVSVGPNATLELGEGPATQRTFLQTVGEIWYSVKKLAVGRRYVVDCRCNVVTSVRGTVFTYAVKGKTARLRVYDGTVAVTSAKKTVLVKKGFETVATSGKAPSAPKKFTPPANPFWES